jgi:hypothetical protein
MNCGKQRWENEGSGNAFKCDVGTQHAVSEGKACALPLESTRLNASRYYKVNHEKTEEGYTLWVPELPVLEMQHRKQNINSNFLERSHNSCCKYSLGIVDYFYILR